jgi:hypothetical protein
MGVLESLTEVFGESGCGDNSERYARELLAEFRREWAAKIRETGAAKGWSTWAAAYLHPDLEFVDTGMPSTETIVAELRRLDRAAVLREAADFYDQVLKDVGTDVACDPHYWTAVRDVARGLRRRADDAERGKDTSGGDQPQAGESTPAPAEPYSYTDPQNHRLMLLTTTDATPDFFQPGRIYSHTRWTFRCETVSAHPTTGEQTAMGWFRFARSTWMTFTATKAEWDDGWRDTTDAPAAEYRSCGADLGGDEYPFTCNRRIAHTGPCGPDRDDDAPGCATAQPEDPDGASQ